MQNLDKKQVFWSLIDETKDELLDLCSQLIRRPSLNPPIQAEEITRFICEYFDRYNITYKLMYFEPEIPIIIAKAGDGEGKTLGFNGHTDVVLPGDLTKWTFEPHCGTITETQILGRGASDMLCGLAIDMHMARLINEHKLKIGGNMEIHIVSDEESGGERGTRRLVEQGYADHLSGLVLGEPTSWNNIETGSKGGMGAIIKCQGTHAYGSVAGFIGDNAIAKMVKIVAGMEELRKMEAVIKEDQVQVIENSKVIARAILKKENVGEAIDHVTYNVNYMRSGAEGKAECEYCEVGINFRVPNGVAIMDLKKRFEDILNAYPGVEYEYNRMLPAAYTPVNECLVQAAVKNAAYICDKEVLPVYQWASSDGLYYRHAGIPAIQYGPANIEGVHGYNECAEISEIIDTAKVHAAILVDVLMDKG